MTIRPPAVHSRLPIRRLGGALAAKFEARQAAGLDTGYPRRRLFGRVVLPVSVLGVVDLPVFIASAVTAHSAGGDVIAAVSGGVLVIAAGVATVVSRFILRDPLRLTGPERRALNEARQWQSAQPWLGPASSSGGPSSLSASPERILLDAAVDAVARIVASPSWRSGYLAEHRQRLDLAAELDQIDEQAYRLAELGAGTAGGSVGSSAGGEIVVGSAALGGVRAALIQRVQGLRGYADRLTALDEQLARAGALEQNGARIDALLTGSATDELAGDQVSAMTAELDYLSRAIDGADGTDGSAPDEGHSPDR